MCVRGLKKGPFNVMRAVIGCVPQKAFEFRPVESEPGWVEDETEYDYAMFFCGRYPLMRKAWILLECVGKVKLVKGPFAAGPYQQSAPLPEEPVTFPFKGDCYALPLGVVNVEAHKHGLTQA